MLVGKKSPSLNVLCYFMQQNQQQHHSQTVWEAFSESWRDLLVATRHHSEGKNLPWVTLLPYTRKSRFINWLCTQMADFSLTPTPFL